MCGIFGVVDLVGRPALAYESLVARGVDGLRHRGPDGSGVQAMDAACLGHARLAIIDPKGGVQPMWSTCGRGLIVYNGELYNHRDLRPELEAAGHRFGTTCDTETILAAYLHWGPECLACFRGMFAFAAVDKDRGTCLIARDRLGIKPLFYVERDCALFFSSEIEPLYRVLGGMTLDLEVLDEYLSWQYVHAPRTIYREISQLLPGHFIEIPLSRGATGQAPTPKRYWNLAFQEDSSLSFKDWTDRLDGLVREAVHIRLMSDVPFGAFLSGGVDSSLVVSYMREALNQPVKTFSIGFDDADYSELAYARQAAQINGCEHHEEIVVADSFGLLPTLVRHYGQPFADSSAIPTYRLSAMTARHVKMALSGDGGDENFAGYHSYESVYRVMYPSLADSLRGAPPRWKALARYFLGRLLRLSHSFVDAAYQAHCMTAYHFSPQARRDLYKPAYRGLVRDVLPSRRALMDIGEMPLITRLQHLDLMAYLPCDILTKVDIASMANSLEVRVPLLDHVLVEAAATIPSAFKLLERKEDGRTVYEKKWILRELAKRRYPEDLIERRKMGFGVPMGRWFAGKLRPELEERLLRSPVLPLLFEREAVRDLVARHSAQYDLSARLWNLVFLDEWMRTHADALPVA